MMTGDASYFLRHRERKNKFKSVAASDGINFKYGGDEHSVWTWMSRLFFAQEQKERFILQFVNPHLKRKINNEWFEQFISISSIWTCVAWHCPFECLSLLHTARYVPHLYADSAKKNERIIYKSKEGDTQFELTAATL